MFERDDVGYKIDFQLPKEFQKEICEQCNTVGFEVHDIEYAETPKFWKVLSLRNIDPLSCPTELREFLISSPDLNDLVVPNYYFKLHPDFIYTWDKDPFSQKLKQYLNPLRDLFKKLNHVMIVMLKPGYALPEHRDLLPGNIYDKMTSPYTSELGLDRLEFRGEHWFSDQFYKFCKGDHSKQNYYSLRVPFSSLFGQFGKSYVKIEGERHYYSPEGRAFVMDDRVVHGADPVEFERGVVFVDGILNLEKLKARTLGPLSWL